VRAGLIRAAGGVLLAGPTALAFYTGGYFQSPRTVAGAAVWLLAALGLILAPRHVPRSPAVWLAIGGMALLSGWTLLSIIWAPIQGLAYNAGQLAMLYLGALVAAAVLLRGRAMQRAITPGLAAGALIVVGYGISARLVPGVLHFVRSVSAAGRLEQPLTYWNAMGELAAIGFVLCAAVAGERVRPRWLRSLAVAGAAPLGLGLYLSFSRGALLAAMAGLVALVVVGRHREQLRASLSVLVVGALASAGAATLKGVTALSGSLSTREQQGGIALAVLIVVMVGGGLAHWWLSRREVSRELPLPRGASWLALGVILAVLAGGIFIGARESAGQNQSLPGGATRLVSLRSNRFAYWDVAMRAFASEPLHGVGAGGWSVWWLRYRTVNEFAQDAHSWELQTLAELGLVGLAALLVLVAGVVMSARRALVDSGEPGPAQGGLEGRFMLAGWVAGLVVYLIHSPLDWDWQMPALTLVAVMLAGAVLARAEETRAEPVAVRDTRLHVPGSTVLSA
jgi:uncharacterized membrane protein YidH (DUF202 family)